MDFLGFTLKRFVWKTKVCDHQVENQGWRPARIVEADLIAGDFFEDAEL